MLVILMTLPVARGLCCAGDFLLRMFQQCHFCEWHLAGSSVPGNVFDQARRACHFEKLKKLQKHTKLSRSVFISQIELWDCHYTVKYHKDSRSNAALMHCLACVPI